MHAHAYGWKLGPGFVLLAKVCPPSHAVFSKRTSLFWRSSKLRTKNVYEIDTWPSGLREVKSHFSL